MIKSISASKLESFSHCPYLYKLKYLKRVGKGKNTNAIYFGRLVHRILELFIKNYNITYFNTNKALELAKAITIKESKKYNINPVRVFNKYIKPFIGFFDEYKLFERKLKTEYKIKTTLKNIAARLDGQPISLINKYRNVKVIAIMDLVIDNNIIVDYKVYDNIPNVKYFKIQKEIYSMLFNDDITFIFLFLTEGKYIMRIEKLAKETHINRFNNLLKLLYIIDHTKRFKSNPKNCNQCLFKDYCKYGRKVVYNINRKEENI